MGGGFGADRFFRHGFFNGCLFPRLRGPVPFQGQRQHLIHVFDRDEPQRLAHLFGQLGHVFFVGVREKNGFDPFAVRGEEFLFNPAHGQHTAGDGYFAGHGQVFLDRQAGEQTDQRRSNGNPRRRAVLGHGTLGEVNMEIRMVKIDPFAKAAAARIRQRGADGFFHDIA